jgi:hypothetical protein
MEKLSVAQVQRLLWWKRGSKSVPVVQRFKRLSYPARQNGGSAMGKGNARHSYKISRYMQVKPQTTQRKLLTLIESFSPKPDDEQAEYHRKDTMYFNGATNYLGCRHWVNCFSAWGQNTYGLTCAAKLLLSGTS